MNLVKSVTSSRVLFFFFSPSDAAEWLRTTDEVLSSWKNITNLEAGTTYELRVVATNGGVTRASHIEEVTTDGIGMTAYWINFFVWIGLVVRKAALPNHDTQKLSRVGGGVGGCHSV